MGSVGVQVGAVTFFCGLEQDELARIEERKGRLAYFVQVIVGVDQLLQLTLNVEDLLCG